MDAIEKAWFGHQDSCPEQGGSTLNYDSLPLGSFKGLFGIAGVVSIFALVVSLSIFLYENRDILASEVSISQKRAALAAKFDEWKGPRREDLAVKFDDLAVKFDEWMEGRGNGASAPPNQAPPNQAPPNPAPLNPAPPNPAPLNPAPATNLPGATSEKKLGFPPTGAAVPTVDRALRR